MSAFSEQQKQYLDGLARGVAAARTGAKPAAGGGGPERIHAEARERAVAAGGRLTREEEAKRTKNALDLWDEIAANAARGEFPKGTDAFLYKFHGLFHVAPAEDAFMCRLRICHGVLDAARLRALASIAGTLGDGAAWVTTRSNLQLRGIAAADALAVLERLGDAGLTSRGSGADNIRNITGTPTAGIDAQEIFDTRPLASSLHHAILNHRELYGLPRKLNVSFDGAGAIAALADTNDIAFGAVRVREDGGVRFRVAVGGTTGHGDFAADLGVAIDPERCTEVAIAILRLFIDEGDRTDRKRARLKYVLDRLGPERFLDEVEKRLPAPLPRVPLAGCAPRPAPKPWAHVGFHAQRQPGKVYCGVPLAGGRMSAIQMRALAQIAERFGSAGLRLTPWQNVLVPDIDAADAEAAARALEAAGLRAAASNAAAGIVACTGSRGCKFAASDTKRHAIALARHLEERVALDAPVNIHLTGCPNSCAQHAIGDIGLLGAKVALADGREVEGYHLFAGGGFGERRRIAREILRDVPAEALPDAVGRLLGAYVQRRTGAEESFQAFVERHPDEALRDFARGALPQAA